MATVTAEQAKKLINDGEEVCVVYGPHRNPILFDNYNEANSYADKLSTKLGRTVRVLDWETGEYI